MTDNKLSTDSYKGVRDFYPADMAVQRYIFDTWAKTAESFGFERYDASILEPSSLYKAKGAENEEMVNEQTYTFTDRGEREVTLRPEMTPTVARMVAAKRRELAFPLRWYSIPSLYRYERQQRGRMREHWQLNCDIFGADDIAADVEIIALAHQTLVDFGVDPKMFKVRINHRSLLAELFRNLAAEVGAELNDEQIRKMIRLFDKQDKIPPQEFENGMNEIFGTDISEVMKKTFLNKERAPEEIMKDTNTFKQIVKIGAELTKLGIPSELDFSLARGFDYYTGTIFEIFEVDETGNSTGRAMLGGGRYDNLTDMFGGEPVSGIGFGMGDVTMRDFLETHHLIPDSVKSTAATVTVIPMSAEQNLDAQAVAQQIRTTGVSVSTDIGTQKVDKKKARATERGTKFIVVVGEDEISSGNFILKNLETGEEKSGQVSELVSFLR